MKTFKMITISCLVLCLIAGLQDVSYAASGSMTVTLQPGVEGKDAWVYSGDNQNRGDMDGGAFGSYGYLNNQRILLEFDDLSLIPSDRYDTPLTKAVLSIVEHEVFGANHQYRAHLYRITEPWNEMEVTWTHRTTTELWATPGVSFAEEWAWTDFTAQQWYQEVKFDITELVRGWLDGTYPNYGMILVPESLYIDPPGSPMNNYTGFYLSDHTIPDFRPKLTLVPEPATLALLIMGSFVLLRQRRR